MTVLLVLSLSQAEKFNPEKFGQEMQPEMDKLSKHYTESVRMCKLCIKKAHKYQETMRDDEQAIATLNNYIRKLDMYCGPLTSASKTVMNANKTKVD